MAEPGTRFRFRSLLPGILVAATGVGAADLVTSAFTGHHLGVAVLWAVAAGAFFKLVLNEGLARWQLATGQTLLEGAITRLGWPAVALFAPYLLVWSFFVATALMAGCGATLHAIFPVFTDPKVGKIVFGCASSVLGLALVWVGGFRLFEKVVAGCAGVMFITTVVSALLLIDDFGAILRGLLIPSIPDFSGAGLGWIIALIGGVGGTVTVLAYGYWIREAERSGPKHLPACRLDLAVGYTMTALFGMAMVVIGSKVHVEGSGTLLIAAIGDRLGEVLGPAGRWAFLFGALGAVFSSLFGVWQSVPLLFSDFLRVVQKREGAIDDKSLSYRGYLVGIATIPMFGLGYDFKQMQKLYSILGASFMPMLALTLLLLNGRRAWVGELRNHWLTTVLLGLVLGFFVYAGWQSARG